MSSMLVILVEGWRGEAFGWVASEECESWRNAEASNFLVLSLRQLVMERWQPLDFGAWGFRRRIHTRKFLEDA